jgi:hypothetical protein
MAKTSKANSEKYSFSHRSNFFPLLVVEFWWLIGALCIWRLRSVYNLPFEIDGLLDSAAMI